MKTEKDWVIEKIEEAEKFMAAHSNIKTWEDFSEDELDEWNRLIIPLGDVGIKNIQHPYYQRKEALHDWDIGLGGFDD